MNYSIIVPVYNRPDEVDELLQSLCEQDFTDFEVIIVEDGSQVPCEDVCRRYEDRLDLKYFVKPNSGPGQSRNYGAERAQGDWLIILDSDVVLPKGYLTAVEEGLSPNPSPVERGEQNSEASPIGGRLEDSLNYQLSIVNCQLVAWGGPDAANDSFTPVQKAISYAMTSFFTTGGIRGGSSKKTSGKTTKKTARMALDKFYPRSFNMGIRREVYQELGGFSKMRFGEDIDFSYRIVEAGYQTALLPDAWVWHKRRTDFRKFFRQVFNSGIARINLTKRHPGTLKLVHLLPAVFTVGTILLAVVAFLGLVLALLGLWALWARSGQPPHCDHSILMTFFGIFIILAALAPLLLYSLLIFVDSSVKNRSPWVGLLSVPAAFVQLTGYGLGFLKAWWKRMVLKQDEFTAFEKNFYS